jgi:GTPase
MRERVFLVSVFSKSDNRNEYEENVNELQQLAETAETNIVGSFIQTLQKPNFTTYIGKGKIQEIASEAKVKEVKTLIFNDNLSPAQSRNISDITECNVVDRTELILDIFAKHAGTKQAKLQVELAQLEYSFSKLKRMWKHLSRIQGGIGFRGPGEKQIEVDRRDIRRRTAILKKRLSEIENTTMIKRKKRSNAVSVSLVGYTNAGKSTLFNLLTKEDRYVANQLFATLDSKTGGLHQIGSENVVLTDTIGFIRNLPHKLISSFHSTLTDVTEAELLLHVADVSSASLNKYIESVDSVLEELKCNEKNVLMVFNKIDSVDGKMFGFLKKELMNKFPHSVFISAKTGENIKGLISKITEFTHKLKLTSKINIPESMQNLISFIYKNTDILKVDFDAERKEYQFEIKVSVHILENIKKQIEKNKLENYLNK